MENKFSDLLNGNNDKATTNHKRVHNLIIVDESGSMDCIVEQAIDGMNQTLKTIAEIQQQYPEQEQLTTLLTFDSEHTKYHLQNAPTSKIHTITTSDYNPCACTPLYDAIGQSVTLLRRNVAKGDNVLVTIITDGEENSSKEWNHTMVKKLIEQLKKENWTFTFIGTEGIDVKHIASSLSIDEYLQFQQDADGTVEMFACEANARRRYNEQVNTDTDLSIGDFFVED